MVGVVVVGYWWWCIGGGGGGDSLCKGGRCNSCRSARVKCLMCGEGGAEGGGDGDGGGVCVGGVGAVGGRQKIVKSSPL